MRPAVRRTLRFLGLGVLNRLVFREIVPPTLLGFFTYTFLLMMRSIVFLVERVFVQGVPLADGLRLLGAGMPHLIVLTLPMSFLFGVLIGVGRMNADSEITAMQAGGVPARRLLRPILVLAFGLVALNSYLSLVVMPEANRSMRALQTRLFASARVLSGVEARVFFEGFPDLLLYVWEVEPESGYWSKVLLYDRSTPTQERLVLAQRGRVVGREHGSEVSPAGGSDGANGGAEPWLRLENVVTHQFSPHKPETYHNNRNQTQLHKLYRQKKSTVRYSPAMREILTPDLVELVREGPPQTDDDTADGASGSEGRRPPRWRQAGLELHKRFSFPFASLVFGLIGLPLGIGSRSGGRGRGFLISLGVIIVYYITSNHGELLALEGKLPIWLGVWLPNLVLTLTALVLMRGMGRWLGEQRRGASWLAALVRRWRGRRSKANVGSTLDRATMVTGSIPVSLQRRRLVSRFPTLLDRYLVTRFMPPLLLVLLSTSALYVVVDLADRIDEIGRNDAPVGVVLAYYWNLIPQVFLDVGPLGLMIAVLVLLTVMDRRLELTAIKAAGVSLYRVMVPLLLLAVVGSGLVWALQESVVPQANREAKRLLDRIRGRDSARSYSATNRQWLFSRDGTNLFNFLRFDASRRTIYRFTMFRLDETFELRFHLFADRVRYVNGAWVADSGWFRQIFPDGTDEYRTITSPLELAVSEGPGYFGHEHRRPGEMSFRELSTYIGELEASGYDTDYLKVRLYQKLTYPLSALVMVILALPFGLNRGRRRLTGMQSIAVAIGLAIVYFLLVAVFAKMGEAELLPAALGAWAPTVLALLFSVNRLTTVRT